MSEASLFSGRLLLRALPSLTPGGGSELPVLKRLLLPQGELAQFHNGAPPIHYIAALELRTGGVRGNHFHLKKIEHMYVTRGKLEVVAQDMDTREQGQLVVHAGDLMIIQPGVAHAFRTLQGGVAIEFSPTRFDPADIHRHLLI
jgi:mannose-6-phosphate isomerase-like protein (cupin superfamily)